MSWEIERRYLVRVPPEAWSGFGEGRHLRQGYVVAGPKTVRIRSGEERGFVLTCKRGSGIRREEVEAVVAPDMAEALFEAAEDRIIEKVRHRLGPWELDRFLGALEGLHLLEIELDAPDAAVPSPPAEISILREVTDDNRFVSSMLASMTPDHQRSWVRGVYREVDQ
ncbi:MAG: adenylate cyclase [Gemmatimonadota bacterium]|nr:adenylate cyclase [Gemmatimonadota bacterium]